jgi:hypothetical protein
MAYIFTLFWATISKTFPFYQVANFLLLLPYYFQ